MVVTLSSQIHLTSATSAPHKCALDPPQLCEMSNCSMQSMKKRLNTSKQPQIFICPLTLFFYSVPFPEKETVGERLNALQVEERFQVLARGKISSQKGV